MKQFKYLNSLTRHFVQTYIHGARMNGGQKNFLAAASC